MVDIETHHGATIIMIIDVVLHLDSLLLQSQGLAKRGCPLGEQSQEAVCVGLRDALQPLQGCLEPAHARALVNLSAKRCPEL